MTARFKLLLAASLSLLATPAFAHPGHDGIGLTSGLLHPLMGLDHLLAMLMVGLWAAQLGGRARWRVPGAFLAVMASGAVLSMRGVALPMVESGIAASLLVLGLMVALAGRVSSKVATTLVGVFALFHGAAHGSELPSMATPVAYTVGFLMATAALHAAGLLLPRVPMLTRVAGAATAAAGLFYAFA